MVSGRVKCDCRVDAPVVVDQHGLTPDGNVPSVVAGPDCAFCGNTGWTTRWRIRAGDLGGVLFIAGCLMGCVSLALLLAALPGVIPYQMPVTIAAVSVTSLLAALLVEKALAKSAPLGPGPSRPTDSG